MPRQFAGYSGCYPETFVDAVHSRVIPTCRDRFIRMLCCSSLLWNTSARSRIASAQLHRAINGFSKGDLLFGACSLEDASEMREVAAAMGMLDALSRPTHCRLTEAAACLFSHVVYDAHALSYHRANEHAARAP